MKNKKYWILVLLFLVGLIVSAIHPKDYFTWILEVFPGIIGCLLLILTFRKFRFSYITYSLILVHCYILFVGGHYTYAEVPLFDWIREIFHQSRNNYDKIGHFAQGFVPALIVREMLIRKQVVKPGMWLSFLTVCVCVTISVMYEFLEWFVAIVSGQSAEAFLGTQGDVWDTQSDMFFALMGASCMIIFMSRLHNAAIARVTTKQTKSPIYRKMIDDLVEMCHHGQGQISPDRVRNGLWNINATEECCPDQHEINLWLKRLSESDRNILATMLVGEVEKGVFETLKVLEAYEIKPFEDGYEGSPFNDFIGRLDDWEWPE